jgi:hypothetical protein
MRCCAGDEGLALRCRPAGGDVKPPQAALAEDRRGERWGKGAVMRQVGTGKASVSEPLTTCRNKQLTSEPDRLNGSGMSLAGARLLARRCPAWRRRESGLRLLHGTWEGGCRHRRPWRRKAPGGERERAVRRKPEALSTVAASAGGPARSSGEALVTGVERRGRLICRSVRANNRGLPREEAGGHVGTAGQAV